MRYELRVTAFDMLDQVHIVLALMEDSDVPDVKRRTVVTRTTTVRGSGESDPSVWARDALVAAVECL